MLALYAGERIYRHCDFDAYLAWVADHRDGLWLRLSNMANHAVCSR